MLLYCPPSTAGFFSFLRRWRPTAEIAKDQIASLYASMNCDSRYGVVLFVSIAESVLLIFISIIFLWQSCLLASTRRPPLSSDILLRRLLDLTEDAASTRAEFARRSMEIPPAVQPSSATARERRQVVRAVAVVMAMKPSVANKDVRQASGRRVLSESPPQNEESPLP